MKYFYLVFSLTLFSFFLSDLISQCVQDLNLRHIIFDDVNDGNPGNFDNSNTEDFTTYGSAMSSTGGMTIECAASIGDVLNVGGRGCDPFTDIGLADMWVTQDATPSLSSVYYFISRTGEVQNACKNNTGATIFCPSCSGTPPTLSTITAQSAVNGAAFANFAVTSDQVGKFFLEWHDGTTWNILDAAAGQVQQGNYGASVSSDNFTIDDNSPAYSYAVSNGSVQLRIRIDISGNQYTGSTVVFTICNPPTQATSFTSSLITSTTATISFTAGNGGKRIVVARASSAVSGDPTQFNSSYSADPAYGLGASLGGGYVVFNGTQETVDLTGLTASTTYHFAVYEFTYIGGGAG